MCPGLVDTLPAPPPQDTLLSLTIKTNQTPKIAKKKQLPKKNGKKKLSEGEI